MHLRTQNLKFKIQNLHTGRQCSKFLSYACSLFTLCCLLFIFSCTKTEKMYKESRVLMDTFCSITVISPSREKAEEAIEAGFAEIKKLEILINYFSPDSELSEINRSAGIAPVKVSSDTIDLITKTLRISRASHGAFDPSIAPLIKLWDISRQNKRPSVPASNYIHNAMTLVDFKKIEIDDVNSEVYLKERGMEIDLGGIAKGYTAGRAADAIKNKGISSGLVAIAGDIMGFGMNTTGMPWKVGIQNPRPETETEKPWEDIIASIWLEDRAISTSGDYQRFFFQNGKRYHHILDRNTGYPADSDLISVTVIAPEGYMADGLSTAVFVLGAQKGLALINDLGIDAVIINNEKKVIITPGLKNKIELLDKTYELQS